MVNRSINNVATATIIIATKIARRNGIPCFVAHHQANHPVKPAIVPAAKFRIRAVLNMSTSDRPISA
jgi:hypothetical protein